MSTEEKSGTPSAATDLADAIRKLDPQATEIRVVKKAMSQPVERDRRDVGH